MNVENVKKTIEIIKASTSFDQDKWSIDCNTPGCVAGHAVTLRPDFVIFFGGQGVVLQGREGVFEVSYAAGEFLGFNQNEIDEVFSPIKALTISRSEEKSIMIKKLEKMLAKHLDTQQ